MFSKTTEYAIRAIIFLAVYDTSGKLIGAANLAHELNFPEAFLGKILQKLAKNGLVISVKGPKGGFLINESTLKKSILDIVEILEGLDFFNKCGLGLHACNDENPCPIHHDYQPVKQEVKKVLSSKTIGAIKSDIKNGNYTMYFNVHNVVSK